MVPNYHDYSVLIPLRDSFLYCVLDQRFARNGEHLFRKGLGRRKHPCAEARKAGITAFTILERSDAWLGHLGKFHQKRR